MCSCVADVCVWVYGTTEERESNEGEILKNMGTHEVVLQLRDFSPLHSSSAVVREDTRIIIHIYSIYNYPIQVVYIFDFDPNSGHFHIYFTFLPRTRGIFHIYLHLYAPSSGLLPTVQPPTRDICDLDCAIEITLNLNH